MNAGRIHVPELVNGECALVRHGAPLAAPEGPAHEVFTAGARRPSREAEDTPFRCDPKPVLVKGVVVLSEVRVSGFERLAGGEVACLPCGDGDKPLAECLPSLGRHDADSFTKTNS